MAGEGLYPLELLPNLGLPEGEGPLFESLLDARSFSSNEKSLLQSAFVWVRTWDERYDAPLPMTASYSELWYILKYLDQLQQVSQRIFGMFQEKGLRGHPERYNSANMPHSFIEIMRHDFSGIARVVYNCAHFERDIARLATLYAPRATILKRNRID